MNRKFRFAMPFLAAYPWVGLTIFFVCAILFAFVTQQVLTHGWLTQWDQPAVVAIHNYASHQPAWYTLLMRVFSTIGREGIALISIGLVIAFLRTHQDRELGFVILGVLGGEEWFEIISNLVMRQRPQFKDPLETLLGPGFPSGHMTSAILLSWLILYLLWRKLSPSRRVLFTLIMVIMVIGIAWSRLMLGVHYPTDLLGGVLLGFGWGSLCFTAIDYYFFRFRSKQRSFARGESPRNPVEP